MTGDFEVLTQADMILSKCGRPMPPAQGLSAVEIPVHYFYQAVVENQATQQQYREITGDQTFFLRAISGIPAPVSVYVQFKFPNGRFLQQKLRIWSQAAGVGSNRYNLDREVECPPGTKIWITGDTSIPNPGSAQPFSVLFEGVHRVWMKNGMPATYPEKMGSLPRVFASLNQNIMAPRWMSSQYPGLGECFTYSTSADNPPSFPLPTAGGGQNMEVKIQTDTGWEFLCRRFYGFSSVEDGDAGTAYVRIRESSGYQLTDDYVSLAKLSGNPLPGWWAIPPGKDIIIDCLVVDSLGTGDIAFNFWLEGLRRRKQ